MERPIFVSLSNTDEVLAEDESLVVRELIWSAMEAWRRLSATGGERDGDGNLHARFDGAASDGRA
ncbi:hypothetical protein [Alicyclobacillus acidiphilus]|uniref:hypothetical protein n=1 Tax=Alicyclobacillus acidiphilus TaxID=182455 RepID=UPI0008345CE7|nr:hypothetical protein [Alicyclobacillus acidiphilus]